VKKTDAEKLHKLAKRATALVDTINNTTLLRYLARTSKDSGLTGYRISVYPKSRNRSGSYSDGIHVTIAPAMALRHLKELAKAARDEAKAQLGYLPKSV